MLPVRGGSPHVENEDELPHNQETETRSFGAAVEEEYQVKYRRGGRTT